MNKFDKTIFNFGDKTIKDVVEFSFEWEGDPELIHFVKAGCGCSDAYFEGKEVKGHLNLSQVGGAEGVKKVVNKYITIGFDKNIPDVIVDENRRWKSNPNKKRINLQLAGTLYKNKDK